MEQTKQVTYDMTAKAIVVHMKDVYGYDLSNITIKNKKKIFELATKHIAEQAASVKSGEHTFSETKVDAQQEFNFEKSVETKAIDSMSKSELNDVCEFLFGKSVGGFWTSNKTARKRAIILYKTNGYNVK